MKQIKRDGALFDGVKDERRDFVKKLVAGAAFAAPLLASFSMDGGLIGEAQAAVGVFSNQSHFFCGNQTVSVSNQTVGAPIVTLQAQYHDVNNGTATATASITLNCEQLVITFSASSGLANAELTGPEGQIIMQLNQGANVITSDASYLWGQMYERTVMLYLVTPGVAVPFLPVDLTLKPGF